MTNMNIYHYKRGNVGILKSNLAPLPPSPLSKYYADLYNKNDLTYPLSNSNEKCNGSNSKST